uniref:Plasminogen receptor (KT) n=1 Tax=Branchiostoma floridae TaxID=7739 RepID=C3YH42_BRAFL|eukprot:XP_002604267.1 hypothetical protein BRAFLDRAFT_88556 [Branchiostoma floridae]
MGSIMGKAMDDNLAKMQAFQLNTMQMQLERQLQMQNQMRERMMAMQISRARETLNYFGAFYALVAVGGLGATLKRKTPGPILPLVPLTFILAYQYDMAYGTMIQRMREGSEHIISDEYNLLSLPAGLPTFETIEAARLKQKGQ